MVAQSFGSTNTRFQSLETKFHKGPFDNYNSQIKINPYQKSTFGDEKKLFCKNNLQVPGPGTYYH